MDPDHLSTAFFSVEVLVAVTFLGLMMVFYSQTTLIPRVSFRVCGFFGLQMRYLFVWLSVVTYLITQFVSNTLLAMLLVLAIDKVLNCVHEQQLDVHRSLNVSEEVGIFQALGGKGTPVEQDTDILFDELAAAVFKYRKQSAASRRSLYGNSQQEESSSPHKLQPAKALSASPKSVTPTEPGSSSTNTASGAATRMVAPPPLKMVMSPGDVATALVDASFTPVVASVTPIDADAFLASVSTSTLTRDKKDSKQTTESKSSGLPAAAGTPSFDPQLLGEKQKRGKRSKGLRQETGATPERKDGIECEKSRKRRKKRSVCIAADANIEPDEQKEELVCKNKHKTMGYSLKTTSPPRELARSPPGQTITFTPESGAQTPGAVSPEPLTEPRWADAEEKPGEKKDGPWLLGMETDPRRPSILKVRDSSGRVTSPRSHSPHRFSVVDFGPTTCRTLTEHFPPEMPSVGRPVMSDWGNSKQNSPDADRRLARFDHKEHPHFPKIPSPFGAITDHVLHLELSLEEQLKRTRRLESLRTAFLVSSTLVTVTGSLASYWTIPARGAMQKHFTKDGVGTFTWVILTMPTALLSTLTCCIPLFLMHLKESDVADDSEDQREICTLAITKLNNMGPFKAWDLITLAMFGLYFLMVFTARLTGVNLGMSVLLLLCILLVICSSIGPNVNDLLSPSRMLLWRAVVSAIPWGVITIYGSVQVISKVVEANRLLPALLESMGGDFWQQNSILANQIAFAVFGSILAEVMNNTLLCNLVVPFVLEVAAATRTAPLMYAIPAAVTCSSNIILPISMPLVLMHEFLPVSMAQLLMIGFMTKVIIVITIIASVNTTGRLMLAVAHPPNTTTSTRPTLLFHVP